MITDHFPIFWFTSLKIKENESVVSYINFSQQNYINLDINFNSMMNFENIYALENVNDSLNFFMINYIQLITHVFQ